jgi:nucleoside-diphosphate-sugar epimerase
MVAIEDFGSYRGIPVLVLGAAGFIGRWVARALYRQGADLVLAVRDRPTAWRVFSDYGIMGRVVVADLADPAATRELIGAIQPALVFNLAGYGVDPAERDEPSAYQLNARLVQTVCEAMAGLGNAGWAGRRVVHVGSALEYGELGGDLAEDSVPSPTTLYGRSKLAGTQAMVEAGQRLGLSGVTARLFTVYGPGEHPDRLLPSLLGSARTSRPLALTAGIQQRDFTYVEDVAEGLLRLGCSHGEPGDVVNLATGRLATVREFAETAAVVLGILPGNLHFGAIPTRPEEMRHDPVNIDKIRRILCWMPQTSLAEGIQRTWLFEREDPRPTAAGL